MSESGSSVEKRLDAYWWWFGAALFLLVPADMITTIVAVSKYGTGVEANPIMRWLLSRGLVYVTVANLVAALLAVCLFSMLLTVVRRTTDPHDTYLSRAVETWLGLLLAFGLLVVTNNIAVLVWGESVL